MTGGFSKELKDIVAESRSIALELGYNYISTLHIFLADCRLKNVYSIHDFAFENNEAFLHFFEQVRVGAAYFRR